jgi:hypothetical protein
MKHRKSGKLCKEIREENVINWAERKSTGTSFVLSRFAETPTHSHSSILQNFYIMEFPPRYVILDADRFATAEPREPGDLGAEVLAQVRSTGRIADHFRVTLGGSRIIDVSAPLAAMMQGVPSTWQFRFQVWPRDVEIRRNIVSTTWLNVHSQLAAKEAWIVDQDGVQIPQEVVMEEIQEKRAAFRFIVVISDSANLELMLQALPAAKETLTGKPAFRG